MVDAVSASAAPPPPLIFAGETEESALRSGEGKERERPLFLPSPPPPPPRMIDFSGDDGRQEFLLVNLGRINLSFP